MPAYKMINLFQHVVVNLSPKTVSYGTGVPEDHGTRLQDPLQFYD